MKKITTDVDIDCYNRDAILSGMESIFARIDRPNGKVEKHPTGVYFQNIPRDPSTNISTLDHRIANEYGYFKVDFLNVNMYEGIRSESHLVDLLNTPVNWELFQYEEITDQLFHLNGYGNLLREYKPQSVEDLAMILAIIRPSKAYLRGKDWQVIKDNVWVKDDDGGYAFKRSHGIAYSLAIVVNLNLLLEKLSKSSG